MNRKYQHILYSRSEFRYNWLSPNRKYFHISNMPQNVTPFLSPFTCYHRRFYDICRTSTPTNIYKFLRFFDQIPDSINASVLLKGKFFAFGFLYCFRYKMQLLKGDNIYLKAVIYVCLENCIPPFTMLFIYMV